MRRQWICFCNLQQYLAEQLPVLGHLQRLLTKLGREGHVAFSSLFFFEAMAKWLKAIAFFIPTHQAAQVRARLAFLRQAIQPASAKPVSTPESNQSRAATGERSSPRRP